MTAARHWTHQGIRAGPSAETQEARLIRSPSIATAVIGMMLASAPAAAAPLCHDLKGLFTPCAPGTPYRSHRAKGDDTAASPAGTADAGTGEARDAGREKPGRAARIRPAKAHPERPPLFTMGKLCRDGRGLFTPCAR